MNLLQKSKTIFNDFFSDFGEKKFFLEKYRRYFSWRYDIKSLPQLTYPALRFLMSQDFKSSKVLEWSSDPAMSLFWGARSAQLISFDCNPTTHEKKKHTAYGPVELFLSTDPFQGLLLVQELAQGFNIFVLDHSQKFDCAALAIRIMNPKGFILVNDSEKVPRLCSYLQSQGFQRFDFEGYTPFSLKPQTTSIFSKSNFSQALPQPSEVRKVEDFNGLDHPLIEGMFGHPSFSQEGEDVFLDQLTNSKKNGFYVDVGAHHPFRFSNTYRLYLNGWHGLNIDPNPEVEIQFKTFRPRDKTWTGGISDHNGSAQFYRFNEPALNTLNPNRAKELAADSPYKLIQEATIPIKTLTQVLDEIHAPNSFDFLNIDVEGAELQVLKGFDFKKYRPQIIFIESLSRNDMNHNDPVQSLLVQNGYQMIASFSRTLVYIETP
jgi:FkbM family methyltransferase